MYGVRVPEPQRDVVMSRRDLTGVSSLYAMQTSP